MTIQNIEDGLYLHYENALKSVMNNRLSKDADKMFLYGLRGFKTLGFTISKEYLKNLMVTNDKKKKTYKLKNVLKRNDLRKNIQHQNKYIQEKNGYCIKHSKKIYSMIVI